MGGVYRGRDLRTGEVKREFPLDVKHNSWFHQRCYRSRATERFIMPSATGIEYVDVRGEHWETHHWVRGACLYGILPANGLTYATPHPCACFMESMVRGFSAFASESSTTFEEQGMKGEVRFQKGPAYDRFAHPEYQNLTPETTISDWPMYRRDTARSGYASTRVEAEVREAWTTDIGNRITPPIAAGGAVFVAAVDQYTIHALDENDGSAQWTFMAGGRIDSPLGWTELGCYGNTFNETPHLDRLAREGMRLPQAYAAAPVCSPYRTALLTGQYPARVGLIDYLRPSDPPLSTDHNTIA